MVNLAKHHGFDADCQDLPHGCPIAKLNDRLSQTRKGRPLFVFLTGASGAGKTTILDILAAKLQSDLVSMNFFDSVGVPSPEDMVKAYGSGEKWQEATTHRWVEHLLQLVDQKLIILEGSFNPAFVLAVLNQRERQNALILCLHADQTVLDNRLTVLRHQPELATEDMTHWAEFLKRKTFEVGDSVIDTTHQDVQESSQELAQLILKSVIDR
jgi:Shikimate kinase